MTLAPVRTSASLVPVRALRAGMLAYFAALAAIEVTAGVVVAFSWHEQNTRASVRPEELQQLAELFSRLRIIEAVVAAGAVVTTVLWSFTVVRNASTACRNGRSGAAAIMAWALVPPLVLVLAQIRSADTPHAVAVAVLVAQAAVMYLPFGTIAVASRRVGGPAMPFVRWYVALTLTFLVHEMFTGSFNLADPKPSHDLGRAAALMIASALVLGVMVIMAGEASQSMESATEQKFATHRSWREEALGRFRSVVRQERDSPRPLPTPLLDSRENVLVAAGITVPMHAPQTVLPAIEPAATDEPAAPTPPGPPPAAGGLFAPLTPRTTPRSL